MLLRNTIIMNNVMKRYKEDKLVKDTDTMKAYLSQDMNSVAYKKMVDKVRNKHFMLSWS